MDSSMMNAYKALNRTEAARPQQQGEALLEITLNLEKSLKEIQKLTSEAKATMDSSAAVLMSVNILLEQIKALTEGANRLYIQMTGADKEGRRIARKAMLKNILIGVLIGMAGWLVIAVLVAE